MLNIKILMMNMILMVLIYTTHKLELLLKKTMKLLGSTKDIIDTDKNSENVPRLEIFRNRNMVYRSKQ